MIRKESDAIAGALHHWRLTQCLGTSGDVIAAGPSAGFPGDGCGNDLDTSHIAVAIADAIDAQGGRFNRERFLGLCGVSA